MLIKLPIVDDGKIVYTTFKLYKHTNYFILSLIENKNYFKNFTSLEDNIHITKSNSNNSDITCIKIMTCNNIKKLFYLNIYVPLKIICINDLLWVNYFFNITLISDFTSKFDFFF